MATKTVLHHWQAAFSEVAKITAASIVLGLLALPVALAQDNGGVKRPKIGVAFEGGGALGLGHVGVLEWLEKNHITVDYIAGTSMGGLVGGLYATGNSPAEIRTLIRGIDWDEVLRGKIPFQELSFRRKEDERAYPNDIELGVRHKEVSFPGGLNSGQHVSFILDRAAFLTPTSRVLAICLFLSAAWRPTWRRESRGYSRTAPSLRPFARPCRFPQSSRPL